MADFTLVVGASADNSFNELRNQITELFAKVNKPLTISVRVDGQAAVASCLEQINSMYKSTYSAGSGTLSANISNVSRAAQSASSDMGELTRKTSEYVKNEKSASSVISTYTNSLTGVVTTVKETAQASGELEASVTKVTESYQTAAAKAAAAEKQMLSSQSQTANAAKQVETIMANINRTQNSFLSAGGKDTDQLYQQLDGLKVSINTLFENADFDTPAGISNFKTGLTELQTSLSATNTQVNAFISKQKEAAAAEKRATTDQTARTNAINQYVAVLDRLRDAEEKYTAARNSRNSDSKAAYESIVQARQAMEDYEMAIYDTSTSTDEIRTKTAAWASELAKQKSVLKSTGYDTLSITDKISNLASKFTSWLTISQAIMYAVNAIKKMVSSTIELDTAMTELKKVTNESDATYSQFLDNASERATKIGTSLSDIVSATADFARLGYDIDDASELADAASIYLNVGDDLDSIDDASESIISTMQAFGLEASDAMSIVDKYNEVANNFAISSGGLGEALQRSAAAMYAAGNTLDETIALTTAANTVVQDPESVGTTLKTVSMYLRAAKTEAESAGIETDGMADSVSELRDELLSLTGVDIQIDSENFKSTYEILKELSEVWGDLSDISQANITEMIGGKRNANVISALMENFDIAEEALATSLDSVGSAAAENEKYLDSIQGKISLFKASFEALSSDVISSSFVKGVVSFGTSILNILDELVERFSTLGTILGIIGSFKLIKNFGSPNGFARRGCKSAIA